MSNDSEIYDSGYLAYQLNRSPLRKLIRQVYLNNILKYNIGKAIDFGCGAGELLTKLPKGSIGFEINKSAVHYCRSIELDARLYDPDQDNYMLNDLLPGSFHTLILSHIIEHFENPSEVLESLVKASQRLLIEKIIIIVPCIKGYNFDKSHKTFIDANFFNNKLFSNNKFHKITEKYFPFNMKFVGRFFTYNELCVVFERLKDEL